MSDVITPIDGTNTGDATTDGAVGDLLPIEAARLRRDEIVSPHAFLRTERGRAWIASLLSGCYYTRWYDDNRGPRDMKDCNEIAIQVLDLKRRGAEPYEIEDALEARFSGGQEPEDLWYEDYQCDARRKVDELREEIEDLDDETLDEFDEEEWLEAIREVACEHMENEDDSSVFDMYGSYDRCEIVVELAPDDGEVSTRGVHLDFDDLEVDHHLRASLARLGYTIADYRRASGNKGGAGAGGGSTPRRRDPLVTMEQLRELVENACSNSFQIVLYACVSITDVFDLDLSKPFALGRCSVAAYDSCNGTFHDVDCRRTVVIDPRREKLTSVTGYSPNSICGLYMPHYHTDLRNLVAPERAA